MPHPDKILRFPAWDHFNLETEGEARANSFFRFDLNVASRLLANELASVKAQTRTASWMIINLSTALTESIENLFLVFLADPNSIVLNHDLNGCFLNLLINYMILNRHSLIIMTVLDRVLEKVEEYLSESAPIVLKECRLNFIIVESFYLNVLFFSLRLDKVNCLVYRLFKISNCNF